MVNLVPINKYKLVSKYSIIVPTHNRADKLRVFLNSIKRLNYNKNFYEIIVVDNSSTDNTKLVIKNFIKNNPKINSRYIFEGNIGPSFARNTGIQNAKFPLVVCIDDDVLVQRDLLTRFSRLIEVDPEISIVGGKTISKSSNEKKLQSYLKILGKDTWVFTHTYRKEKDLTYLKFPDDLPSAVFFINTEKIKREKVFNEKFGKLYGNTMVFSEDSELCLWQLLHKKKVVYDPLIISKHIIGDDKLNYRYVLDRFFRAGIEHRLIYGEFGDYGINFYKFDLKLFMRLFTSLVTRPNPSSFIKFAREALYLIGYHFPVKHD